jgi:hypothetical protein
MKSLFVVLVILALVIPVDTISASTLDNADRRSYLVEVIDAGHTYRATILDGSAVALCTSTCQLTLSQTGQSLTVRPDDFVVIADGIMRVVY